MNKNNNAIILCIDDDPDLLDLLERYLTSSGFDVLRAESSTQGLSLIEQKNPDLVLLDIMMPKQDGFEFCALLQQKKEFSAIPVVFLTALNDPASKAKALASGAVGYITKSVKKERLVAGVKKFIGHQADWKKLHHRKKIEGPGKVEGNFHHFKNFVAEKLKLDASQKKLLKKASISSIFSVFKEMMLRERILLQLMTDFTNHPLLPFIDPESVVPGVLPLKFCKKNLIVPFTDISGNLNFVISNPFDFELIDIVSLQVKNVKNAEFHITEPDNIISLLDYDLKSSPIYTEGMGPEKLKINADKDNDQEIDEAAIEEKPVVYVTSKILRTAVNERASDIHFEPKKKNYIIRFRVDGDMQEFFNLAKETGSMVISRLKALAYLDITERRKPQDGGFEASIDKKNYKFRLATTSTPGGESLIIRVLEPDIKHVTFRQLGMHENQEKIMEQLVSRTQGLILTVGPTGSGKTTTIYSLLNHYDIKTKSLITVEDPVEYNIPNANQQQVHEKGGVTFEALLRSSVRQDPDILFIGELRDQLSARTAINFSSTGHIAISTLHASNTSSVIFRLEMLGITRDMIVDAVVAVIAQRLVKKLCPNCKQEVDISQKEINMLSPFAYDLPKTVAHPVGCYQCNHKGYLGRVGIYEILQFDPEISALVMSDKSPAKIRRFLHQRNDYLMSDHAIDNVRQLNISPQDAYNKILIEEEPPEEAVQTMADSREKKCNNYSILVVDDDRETLQLIARFLENAGYEVLTAADFFDTISMIKDRQFDLIISDIKMPDINGLKLFEILQQKGIKTPLLFLTSSDDEENEIAALKLGAVDYVKKTVKKDILLLRVGRAVSRQNEVME